MRRCFTLALCLLLLLTGCAKEAPKLEKPVKFYYCRETVTYGAAGSAFDFELRESAGHEEDLQYLLNQYMRGPESGGLLNTFPQFTRVVRYEAGQDVLSLCLSDAFASLSGMELTLACTVLTMTVHDLTGLDTVMIRAESKLLDGRETLVYNYASLLLRDDAWTNVSTTIEEPKQ